jgi:hypothetical protein
MTALDRELGADLQYGADIDAQLPGGFHHFADRGHVQRLDHGDDGRGHRGAIHAIRHIANEILFGIDHIDGDCFR